MLFKSCFFYCLLIRRVPFPEDSIVIALYGLIGFSHFQPLFSPATVFGVDFHAAVSSVQFFCYYAGCSAAQERVRHHVALF